jgi:hypothetical protein
LFINGHSIGVIFKSPDSDEKGLFQAGDNIHNFLSFIGFKYIDAKCKVKVYRKTIFVGRDIEDFVSGFKKFCDESVEISSARDLKYLVGYPTCGFESYPRHSFCL